MSGITLEIIAPELTVYWGTSYRSLLFKSLESQRIGHRLFTVSRKNGSWNTGKIRFGWSGKNGSDVYSLMIRYKDIHIPPPNYPAIKVVRPRD